MDQHNQSQLIQLLNSINTSLQQVAYELRQIRLNQK